MITTNVPTWVDTDTGLYPPLGLMYVAAAAAEHTEHEIQMLDAEAEGLDYEGIEEHVRHISPDVVGIQTLTFTLIDARLTAEAVKCANPKIHVCLGGPHVNLYPEETIRLGAVDSLVLGEGEVGFPLLLDQLNRNNVPSPAPGLVFLRDGETVQTPPETIADLDSCPMPRRTMLPYQKYYSVLARTQPITTMMTSRGCPFKCLFCDRPHLGKRFRYRCAQSVVSEMEACAELGIREIFFYDDTFSVRRSRVEEVCDAIRDRKLNVTWDIRARVDTVDEPLLRKLKDAGCARIHFGVESGTKEIIRVLRKGIDLDQVRRVMASCREVGITTLAYFMIGNPTETREQIEATMRFALEIKPDYVHMAITTPFPGTDLYRLGLDKGLYENDYWQEFAGNPQPDFVPPPWTELHTREQLLEMLNEGYRRFYMRPRFVLRKLAEIKSFRELAQKARVGIRLALSKR